MNSSLVAFFDLPVRPDPIRNQFPLLDSPWPATAIVLGYLAFVLKLGKSFMKNRKPYNLRNIIIAYNILQVLFNGILFGFSFYYLLIKPEYDRSCMLQLPLEHPKKYIERRLTYAFFINKFLDLADTVFFVLRKSYKQITVLHIYHHLLMSYPLYWGIRYYGFGGQFSTMGFCNTFVHTVMYFYYFISVMNPELKGKLWWKKYITILQLLQFVLLLLQPIQILIFNPSCKVPPFQQYFQIIQSIAMISMFGNFYYKAYLKPKQLKVK